MMEKKISSIVDYKIRKITMKKPILHIPSVVTQSCFVDKEGHIVELLETEVDYFYSLLFLYREQLLEQTQNLLLKNGERYILNKAATIEAVEIELNQFQRCGAVINFKYDGLREFIDNLSELSININLLRKNKNRGIETIKVVDTYSWDSTVLSIQFTEEFINELIGIEKYFMDVNLSNLFNLSGGKGKLLYLVLKDYSNLGNKNFTKNEIILLIGKVPQKSVFDRIIEQINDKTDIKVSYAVEGVKKKKYKFKINHKVNLKSSAKSKSTTNTKTKKSINVDVMEKSKQQLQQMKNKGQKIANEGGYLKTIYDNEMERITATKEEKEIDKILDKMKSAYDVSEYQSKQIPMINFKNINSGLAVYVDNEYRIRDPFNFYTENAEETINKINEWIENNTFDYDVMMMDGYSNHFEKVCLLSEDQLKQRGVI